MLTCRLACVRRLVPLLLALLIPLLPSHAAQFTADLTITSPRENVVYDLKVKDNLIRLEKTRGPMTVPPFPTITNRLTGVTWGLNPPLHQYVEETDAVKTMMMNPVVGWEYMRKDLKGTPAGTETVEGYPCEIMEYRAAGDHRVASRVWVSPDLAVTVKAVTYALNGNATMALRNIKEGPVDGALFTIPPGYAKAVPPAGSSDRKSQKSVKAKKTLSTTVLIKPTSTHAIGLEPERTITITAIGDDAGGAPAAVDMKVLAQDKSTIISEKVVLKNDETKTWEVPPEKLPFDLYLNGEKGQIRFTVEQRTGVPTGGSKAAPEAGAAKSRTAGPSNRASGNIIFILDASGSMWGQVEGTAKIAIAKEVLTGLVQDLPDDAVVGLVAYGHRRKGDCDDVEELIPMGPVDKEKMVAKIQALSPKGKTPISRSVRLTAQRIKGLEDETTIILVSDGKETCDPDPCGLVTELKASGIKFVMHVIGFDVTEAERKQLECMARAGGGEYYTADNAGEFMAAASEVVKKSTPSYGILKVTATKNGKPFFTGVTLAHQESGKRWTPASTSGKSGTVEIRLVPGTYQAELKDTGVSGGQTPMVRLTDIVIVAGETVERTADFSDGILKITTLLNGSPFRGNVFFYRQGEKKHFSNQMTSPSAGQLKKRMLPGVYRIDVRAGQIAGKPSVVIEDLKIPPGGTVEKTVEFSAGELIVTVTLNGEPFATPIEIKDAAGKSVFKNWSNWPKKGTRVVTLPEGVFTVRVTNIKDQKQILKFEKVAITAGESETITAAFPITQ
jgi:Ca-activated chloride channel homolog